MSLIKMQSSLDEDNLEAICNNPMCRNQAVVLVGGFDERIPYCLSCFCRTINGIENIHAVNNTVVEHGKEGFRELTS